jgi:deoxycytidylate deaminase
MMLSLQFERGLRGFAKAQILGSITKLLGILPVSQYDMQVESSSDWKNVVVPQSVVLLDQRVILTGQNAAVPIPEFETTKSRDDARWIERAKGIITDSNCWYDPAGCVIVRDQDVLVEAVSTSYNSSNCTAIPINFKDLPLKKGERMSFCDSQHAERQAVSNAAARGIDVSEGTAYVNKFPCRPCMLNLLGANIRRVVFEVGSYGLADAGLLLDNNVEIERIEFK